MQPNRIVRLLIAIGISAALLSAQVAPSFAANMMFPATGDQMPGMPVQDVQMQSMQMGDMQMAADDNPCATPCCPDQNDSRDCGCPLGICVSTITIAAPSTDATLAHRYPSRSAFALPLDQFVDGIGQRPPDHPPRPLV